MRLHIANQKYSQYYSCSGMSAKMLGIPETTYPLKLLLCQPLIMGFPTSFNWAIQRHHAEETTYKPISMSLSDLVQTIFALYLGVSCICVTFICSFGVKFWTVFHTIFLKKSTSVDK